VARSGGLLDSLHACYNRCMDGHYDNEFIFEPNPLEDIEAMSLPLDRLFVMVRDRLGLLQKDMADLMGITRSTLSDIENGKTPSPNAETLHAFQQAVAQRVRISRTAPSPKRSC
jgi:DNA-binding XRE family transcriptional regulator